MSDVVEEKEAVEVEAAAQLALAGVDPIRFLFDDLDDLELRTLQAVAYRANEIRAEERRELANLIRSEIVEAFG
jgi:hypothetical protein